LEGAERRARREQSSLSARPRRLAAVATPTVDAPAWDRGQKLLEEKTALGFSISGPLFSFYERELVGFARTALARLSPAIGLDGRRGGAGAACR